MYLLVKHYYYNELSIKTMLCKNKSNTFSHKETLYNIIICSFGLYDLLQIILILIVRSVGDFFEPHGPIKRSKISSHSTE